MSVGTYPIPGLFGGVSQQIPAMRHPTQGSEQLNGLATVAEGLYKRPGTKHIKMLDMVSPGLSIAGSYGAAHCHVIDKGDAGRYLLVLVNGSLQLYNLQTGEKLTVGAPDGLSYLTSSAPESDFRCVSVADYTFVVNRTKVPALTSAVTATNAVNVAYVNVRTASPKVLYTVTLDGYLIFNVTSAESTSNAAIAAQLQASIAAQAGFNAWVIPNTNTIKIVKTNGAALACAVSDGWGNTGLQCMSNGVPLYSDLPSRFEQGYVVTILGSADQNADAYYVQWDGKAWVETQKPGQVYAIEPTSMPHQLRPVGDGTWVFEKSTKWAARKVGDDDTNPAPSFIGNPIRSVFFFRNRLGFLAGDSVILSRSGSYYNFWASTAVQVLDTDPIDLASPSEQVEALEWAVPFNQNLLVWSMGKQQFVLASGDILSPETARLQPTTSFETDWRCKPVALGNKVLFVSDMGGHCQVNLYKVSQDTVTNDAEDITSHVPSYVTDSPRQLAPSSVFKALAVVPSRVNNRLAFFKYEADERTEQLTQKAWQEFTFDLAEQVRIMAVHWVGRKLYMVLHLSNATDVSPGGSFCIEVLDFDPKAADPLLAYGARLDRRVVPSVVSYDAGLNRTVVSVPYIGARTPTVLLCAEGAEPVPLAPVTVSQVSGATRLTLQGDYRTSTLLAGTWFQFRYTFTECFLRDREDRPVQAASIKLVRLLLRYVRTGWLQATVKPLLRGTYEYPLAGRVTGAPGQGATQNALSDGTFAIPVQARPEGTTLSVESDSYLPVTLPFAEWVADVTLKAQR